MAKNASSLPDRRHVTSASICVDSSVGGDSDLASAQPEFDRAVTLSVSGFNNNSELFSRDRPGNWMADARLISELCSLACEFQSGHSLHYPKRKSRFIIARSGTIRISTDPEETSISIGGSIRAACLSLRLSVFWGRQFLSWRSV